MSSRKNSLLKYQTVTNGDMSSATLTSEVTSIQFLDNVGIQFNFSGSPVGAFSVEVSIDYFEDTEGNVKNPGNWAAIPLTYFLSGSMTTALSVPSSVGSPIILDLNQLSTAWIRSIYTRTSGTGILNSFITAKVL